MFIDSLKCTDNKKSNYTIIFAETLKLIESKTL